MFGQYFYHQHLRKCVAVFGSLFNNINITKTDVDSNILSTQKVPLAYGPKQKFLARLRDEPDLLAPKVALKLPRMSFEITSFSFDTSAKINKNNHISAPSIRGSNTMHPGAPYILGVQLNILGKTQDEVLQIMEQILPYFNPSYTVTIKENIDLDFYRDIPVTLQSVTMSDDYEGEFEQRRSLIITLDFTMKVKFYGPVKEVGVIKDATVNIRDLSSNSKISTVNDQVSPFAANESDTYNIIHTTIEWDNDYGFTSE